MHLLSWGRRAGVLALAACLLVAVAAVRPGARADATPAPTGTAPVDWGDLSTAGMVPDGDQPLPADTPATFYLRLAADPAGLAAHARAVSDPASPEYGHHASVPELAARFGASPATAQAVLAGLANAGVTGTLDVTRTFVEIDVTVAQASQLFSTTWYPWTWTGWQAAAGAVGLPATPPTLPAALEGHVTAVHGAMIFGGDPAPKAPSSSAGVDPVPYGATSAPASIPNSLVDGGRPARTGTFEGCADAEASFDGHLGLSPAQWQGAYGIDRLHDAGFTGRGTQVAIVDFGDFPDQDLAAFAGCFGFDPPTIVRHGSAGSSGDSGIETTMDVQLLSAVAPDVDRLDLFIDPNPDDTMGGMLSMFSGVLDPAATGGRAPDAVSASFGVCEVPAFGSTATAGIAMVEQVLSMAAAAGVNVVVSTGDSGPPRSSPPAGRRPRPG